MPLHLVLYIVVIFPHLCLLVFARRRVVLRILDPKQLLLISCILWCYYSKCYSNNHSKKKILHLNNNNNNERFYFANIQYKLLYCENTITGISTIALTNMPGGTLILPKYFNTGTETPRFCSDIMALLTAKTWIIPIFKLFKSKLIHFFILLQILVKIYNQLYLFFL